LIPKPLAWGIAIVLTGLEILNMVAAVFVDGYPVDTLFHAVYGALIGVILGAREGSTAVARAISAFRGGPHTPPPPDPTAPPPEGLQGPMP
jgi:hypothetical protein